MVQAIDVVNFTEARNNLSAIMDRVNESHRPLIVTRQNKKPVVVMSLEDYNGMDETEYLMSSPANAARLLEAVEDIRNGKSKLRDIDEFLK